MLKPPTLYERGLLGIKCSELTGEMVYVEIVTVKSTFNTNSRLMSLYKYKNAEA